MPQKLKKSSPIKASGSSVNIFEKLYSQCQQFKDNHENRIKKVNQSCKDLIEHFRVNNRSKVYDSSSKMVERLENQNSVEYVNLLYEDSDAQKKKSSKRNEMWERIHLKEKCTFVPKVNIIPQKEFQEPETHEDKIKKRKAILDRLIEPKVIPIPPIPKDCTFKPRLNIHLKK